MKRLIILLLFTASVRAQPLQIQTSQNADSALRPLTTQEQATVWGITPEEWQRYLTLKQQARGIWSPGLDPLTTLGVEADTDHERQRFAELLVRQEYQRLEKELSFQRAYDAAWQRLYPGLTPLKTTSTSTTRVSLEAQDSLGKTTAQLDEELSQLKLELDFRQALTRNTASQILQRKQQRDQLQGQAVEVPDDSDRRLHQLNNPQPDSPR